MLDELVKDKLDDHQKTETLWKLVVEGDSEKKIIPILEVLRGHERAISNMARVSWALLIAVLIAAIPITIDVIIHVEGAK